MRMLDDSTRGALTVVSAPAGTGKTLTVARWCASRPDLPVIWLNAVGGVPPQVLANHLRAAAGMPSSVAGRVQQNVLIRQVAHDLTGCEAEQVVVIDDAHLLSAQCFALLNELVSRYPQAVRLVLICRWDPPITRLAHALSGNLSVIRGTALQMSRREASELVLAHASHLPPEVVDAILDRAQGWAALIVLATRTVALSPDPLTAMDYLTQRGWVLADMLASQVFSTLSSRTRHLLLCIAFEETVTPEIAVRVSGDSRAGQLLADLAMSGLLVIREGREAAPEAELYRIHPLLLEVLQRQTRSGGVDVMRARAVVRRAARWDATHGDIDQGFRRLVAAQAWDDAVQLIADHGAELLMLGHARQMVAVAHAAPEAIEQAPHAWTVLALERSLRSDYDGARRWLDRLRRNPRYAERTAKSIDAALVDLIQARTDGWALPPTVDRVRGLVESIAARSAPKAPLIWLLTELGAAENWLGRLQNAEKHLRRAASTARSLGLSGLAATAMSHLALTAYMQGHARLCGMLADRALSMVPAGAHTEDQTYTRAIIAQELAASCELTETPGPSDLADSPLQADPTTAVWQLILAARRQLPGDSGGDGPALVDLPTELPPTPPLMSAFLIGERCFRALVHEDQVLMDKLANDFAAIGADAEAAVARALCADLAGDPQAAAASLAPVVEDKARRLLPTTHLVALVYAAQLQDSLGFHSSAEDMLLEAIRDTAAQRLTTPFLHWSASGTPMQDLLHRVADLRPSPWLRELCDHLDEHLGAGALLERAAPAQDAAQLLDGPAHIPTLTQREHDVLVHLARGSSYADVADALYISKNTVKTHVSSLYAKIGASRRSDALTISRTLRLI
ncbi:helix-turn-helix transcriptional regulator [Kribbella sancticallisti]